MTESNKSRRLVNRTKVLLAAATVSSVALLVAFSTISTALGGAAQPTTATVSASAVVPGFIYATDNKFIIHDRVYLGDVDIGGDGSVDGTFQAVTNSVLDQVPLEGTNQGTFVFYLSSGEVVYGKIEGKFSQKLDGSIDFSGTWQAIRASSGVAGPLIHVHGGGEYSGSSSGVGQSINFTLTGKIDMN